MEVVFLEDAADEFNEAVEFYNLQSEDLGNKFISELDKIISIIKKYPKGFSKFSENTRSAVISVFPYKLIYTVSNQKIIIIAVAHQHRKPNYWDKSE